MLKQSNSRVECCRITDQYSAYEKGLVLYYFAYLIRLFGYYFLI